MRSPGWSHQDGVTGGRGDARGRPRAAKATPAGREALHAWLRAPSAPPQFESEAVVKFFFADQAGLADARHTLDGLAADAAALWQTVTALTTSHQDASGPFPDRQHIGTLTGRLMFDYAAMLGAWAAWAREHVDEWPTTGPEAAPLGDKVQRESAELARRELPRPIRPGQMDT